MILVGLGSNLPFCRAAPEKTVSRAMAALEGLGAVVLRSSLYRSPAWPDPTDPPYVNAVVAVTSSLEPLLFLRGLQSIEAAFGRRRDRPNAPRTLDLDLLAYHDAVLEAPRLKVPHPRLVDRDFVLAPLCEIAPDWRHPVLGDTAADLFARLPACGARRIADAPAPS
ncbi:MAG: 2-amino-4-hydroxy-6-hydroxymethyldihydropteridine diphosphokinase [Pseudomonadota bacterium]